MEPKEIDLRLVNAVTNHDRKEAKKRYYNPHALGQYCAAVTRAVDYVKAGHKLRDAILSCFCGRLLDACLKAVGEEKATDEEHHRGPVIRD